LSAQAKHKERFAIRAKYMTLDARVNKYIQYFKNIRIISQHLCRQATKYAVHTPGRLTTAPWPFLFSSRRLTLVLPHTNRSQR
jgi:hypothetical protein